MLYTILIILTLAVIINTVVLFRKDNKNASAQLDKLDNNISRFEPALRNEFATNRSELQTAFKSSREELNTSFRTLREQFDKASLDNRKEIETKLELIRKTVEDKLFAIQQDNNKKLEEMRKTVDEKLQESINRRFNESFKLISERLEEVQKGLGEMQSLASDVGGLKKVLTNVKTRGTFGEVQLDSLLSEILAQEQYSMQAAVRKNTQERVDAVVLLPDKNTEGKSLMLPIDSKFPVEDYSRLIEAYDSGDKDQIEACRRAFEQAVKETAKSIARKYINPPVTTDFAIMFVPSEAIYAETLRNAELFETIRRKERITIVGPTNLAAFLSSLQMGFRTLAIQKRTSEVWTILGAVKTEFGKFGDVLDKASKQLQTVVNTISETGTRTRVIERRLSKVEALPQEQTVLLLDDIEPEAETELLQ